MNVFKKLLSRRYLFLIAIILAVGFGIHYYFVDPLNIALDKPTHTLKDYVKPDKILVVSFWASWCGHCKNEVGVLTQLKEHHPEIDIIGLQVDYDKPGPIFLNANYPSINASENGAQIMQLYGNFTAGVPFIIMLKNKKSKTFLGETDLSTLEQNIASI